MLVLDLQPRFQITRVQSRTILEDPHPFTGPQFDKSGSKFILHLVEFCMMCMASIRENLKFRSGDSGQNVSILAIFRLLRSLKIASFPAATAPRFTISRRDILHCMWFQAAVSDLRYLVLFRNYKA